MLDFETSASDAGKRLDSYLHARLPQLSRSRIQSWIKSGRVRVNGVPQKRSHTLRGTETIQVEPAELAPLRAFPEDVPLEVLYEDAAVIAINKPAGMVVHSGAGRSSGTLVNALLHRFGTLSGVGGDVRPGIVHRLDQFTSGVILVARTDAAHRHLAQQFSSRKVEKIYLALVNGRVKSEHGRITTPIARDPVRRTRMTARLASGRDALTDFKVLKRFAKSTLLEVRLGTGRTHQIRVHLSSIGHPVVGDKLYGAPPSPLGRYFLHAHRITFSTAASDQPVTITASLPPGLQEFLDASS
jgi:23S rRNA pseudouridine1911/1915/1917 synthase